MGVKSNKKYEKGNLQLWDSSSPKLPHLAPCPPSYLICTCRANRTHMSGNCIVRWHYYLSTYSPCVSLWGNSFVATVPRSNQERTFHWSPDCIEWLQPGGQMALAFCLQGQHHCHHGHHDLYESFNWLWTDVLKKDGSPSQVTGGLTDQWASG